MRGILLAGGTGSRLWPITRAVSKQLMPVFDKPMIYYPLSTLVMAGLRDILIITGPAERPQFERLLGDGSDVGLNIRFATQEHPNGIAEAFVIGEGFIGDDSVALILGDNIFHGAGLGRAARPLPRTPGRRGLRPRSLRPDRVRRRRLRRAGPGPLDRGEAAEPQVRYAVPGLYFYDNRVVEIAKGLKPSGRGELEITDVNKYYLDRGELQVSVLDRGTVWLDTGTFQSLVQASEYVRVVEERQGMKIGCLEEAAWRAGFIDDARLRALAEPLTKSGYGDYLLDLLAYEA